MDKKTHFNYKLDGFHGFGPYEQSLNRSKRVWYVYDVMNVNEDEIIERLAKNLMSADRNGLKAEIVELLRPQRNKKYWYEATKPHPMLFPDGKNLLMDELGDIGPSKATELESVTVADLNSPLLLASLSQTSFPTTDLTNPSGPELVYRQKPTDNQGEVVDDKRGVVDRDEGDYVSKGVRTRLNPETRMLEIVPDQTSAKLAGTGVRMVGEGLLDTAGKQYPDNVPYVQTSEDLEDEYAQLTYDRKRKLRFGMQEDKPEKMQRMFQYRNVRRPTWDKGKRIIPEGGRSVRSLYKPAASVRSMNVNGLPTLPPPIKPTTYDVRYDDKGFKLVEKVPTRRGVPIRRPEVVQDLQADARARQRAEALGEERRQAREELERSALFDELPGMVDLPTGPGQVPGVRQADSPSPDIEMGVVDDPPETAVDVPPEPGFGGPLVDMSQSYFGFGMNPRLARIQAQMRNHKNFRNHGGRGMARKGAGSNLMG